MNLLITGKGGRSAWLLAAAGALLFATSGLCQPDRGIPGPIHPELHEVTYIWDTDLHAGLFDASRWQVGGTLDIYFDDYEIPYEVNDQTMSGSLSWCVTGAPCDKSAGYPYYVRRRHEVFSCLSSYSRIVNTWDHFPYLLVPHSGETIGHGELADGPITEAAWGYPPDHAISLSIYDPLIGRSLVAPGEMRREIPFPLGSRQRKITVVYSGQPGRPTQELTPQTTGGLALVWGDLPSGWVEGPLNFHVAADIPLGLVAITNEVEGYTSDTLMLEPLDLTGYIWTPLSVPLAPPDGGPGVDDEFPGWADVPPDIVAKGVTDLMTCECKPAGWLADAVGDGDKNNDAVRDVADVIRAAAGD